ncbi:energy transducer TonB [Nitrospira sp. BLG_1]|uniref:energy transducer TonB n=1 Tax=Nitrospira sp. BLG_1 TaxID=3395883 RepID=UPI0039BC38AE
MSNDCQTVEGQWGIKLALFALCILLVSCSHKGTRVGAEQAPVQTPQKAMADGTTPGAKAYLALVQQRIRHVWKAPALDFTNRTYATVVKFRLHKNGSVSLVNIEQSSGNESYDAAGKQAVLNASPLPAFPPDLSHAYVDAHITLTAPSEKE